MWYVLTGAIITRGGKVVIEFHQLYLVDGDQVLLCTDGLTEMVIDTFGGNLAVIAYKTEKGTESDEMCFIDPEGDVRIFSTTEECVRFLEQKAKAPLWERIFTRPVMSGVVFVFLLEHVPPRLNQGDSRGAKDGRVYRH